jgi:hypothetical protein
MSWASVAIGAGAAIGGIGSYFSSKSQSDAANKALQFQQQQYQQNQQNIQPYLSMGQNATQQIGNLYGPNGPQGNWQQFLQSPDYQFSFDQGMKALQNSSAAKGGLLGGNFAQGAINYGQGAANQQFGNYYNRLFGQAQLGQNAAAGAGALGNQSANMIGSTYNNVGAANASGFVGGANAINGGVQNYLFNNAMNKSSYGNQPQTNWWGGLNGSSGQNMYQGPLQSGSW